MHHGRWGNPSNPVRGMDTPWFLPGLSQETLIPVISAPQFKGRGCHHRLTGSEGSLLIGVWDTLWDAGIKHFRIAQDLLWDV